MGDRPLARDHVTRLDGPSTVGFRLVTYLKGVWGCRDMVLIALQSTFLCNMLLEGSCSGADTIRKISSLEYI